MSINMRRDLDKKNIRQEKTRKRTVTKEIVNRSKIASVRFENSGILPTIPQDVLRVHRGRPSLISDPNIHNRRDHLVQIFEAHWGAIGWPLRKVETPDELIPILSVCFGGISEDVITAFNMLSKTCGWSSADLRAIRRFYNSLTKPILTIQESLRDAEERLNRARAALTYATAEQRPLVETGLAQCEEQERQKREEQRLLYESEKIIRDKLRFGGARFARQELFQFLTSNRYELTPMSLANAAAGLPYMGWRQSMRRCSGVPCRAANSTRYQVFKVIRYLISTSPRRSKDALIDHFRDSIPSLPYRYRLARQELAKGWYFLERAIGSVFQDKLNPKAYIFEITKRYFSYQYSPTQTDLFLAEQSTLKL